MSRSILFAGALALIVGGCASSAEPERPAESHEARARQAAAYENYDQAAHEKHEADRLRAKAADQRADEAAKGEIITPTTPPPAEVPPPPAPLP